MKVGGSAYMISRREWIGRTKARALERYNEIFSQGYDVNWGQLDPTHVSFVNKLLERLPAESYILDAPCGTGKYWPLVEQKGCRVLGVDQSKGMLENAKHKYPHVQLVQQSLQELSLGETFDGILCVDSMENVPPEDWPLVLTNLCQHLRDNGWIYLTVELESEETISQAYLQARAENLPIAYGEVVREGYHYYPELRRVLDWLRQASLQVMEIAEGDGYRHFLCYKQHK